MSPTSPKSNMKKPLCLLSRRLDRFPDMPCMKKAYSVKKTLASSQERRAPFVQCGSPRRSNAGFVPPPVYVEFRLFMLLKSRSRQLCSMPWGVRGTVVPWANRFVEVPPCPAPPSRCAPSRRARGMSGFWIRQVIGDLCWQLLFLGHGIEPALVAWSFADRPELLHAESPEKHRDEGHRPHHYPGLFGIWNALVTPVIPA